MLVRVPPKYQGEVRLTLEKGTESLLKLIFYMRQMHLTQIPAGVVLCGIVEVVGSNLARGEIFTASIGSVDLRLICNTHQTDPIHPYPTVI